MADETQAMKEQPRSRAFYVACAISGVLWAALVSFVFLEPHQREYLASGWIFGPAIGIAAGQLSARFKSAGIVRMAAVALGSLYMTAALFGYAAGLVNVIAGVPNRGPLLTAFLMIVGLTVFGYVIALWPVAYLNHRLVARFVGPKEPPILDLGLR